MFDLAELKRKLKNIVYVASIVSTKSKEGKALATVRVGENEESGFFPVLAFSNSFKKHWVPIRKDEQVLILHPFGNANKGYMIRGIFNMSAKEPAGASDVAEVIEFEDGARFIYDTSTSTLTVMGVKQLTIRAANIVLDGEVTIAGNLYVKKSITDKLGTVTDHEHDVADHLKAIPR